MMLFGSRFLKRPAEMTAADRADYNARVGRQVDDFRTFVNTHYMTERDDTPFWREVRRTACIPRPGSGSPSGGGRCRSASISSIFSTACRTSRRSSTTRCSTGSASSIRGSPKPEMARAPSVRAFARKTVDSLVREYKQAATKALGHAEFLAYVRDNR